MPCAVTFISGLDPNSRRGLAFLQIEGDADVNAKSVFERLPEKTRLDVLARFQHWMDGQVFDDYHHGWNAPENRSSYVFKSKQKRVRQRMYGFLIHPRKDAPQFMACILVSHTPKSQHETDPAHLSLLNKLRQRPDVRKAVVDGFQGR